MDQTDPAHETPSREFLQGLHEFNAGEYFECHETLEGVWQREPRPERYVYQGILQVAVALLQIERRNWIGAVKMLRRGLPRLDRAPDRFQGVNLARLRRETHLLQERLLSEGAERIDRFDRSLFPHIDYEHAKD